MYQIGDVILYTTSGVCKVVDIVEREFNGQATKYYVLKPINDSSSSLTVPANNPLTVFKFHNLLTKDEIYEVISEFRTAEPYWIDRDNDRKNQFAEIIRTGNRLKIYVMIKSIKERQTKLREKGRKLHASDEATLRDAERIILEEICYVLSISKTEALNLLYAN